MGGYGYKNLYDLSNYFQDKRRMLSSQLPRRLNPEAFRHICAVLSPKGNVLGVGYNHCYTSPISMAKHAEHHGLENAMHNIIRKNGRDRLMKGSVCVDILVLRDTGSNSRPCNNCITKHIAGHKYFNVRNIYYSHETDGLVETNANALFETRHEHYSSYYANCAIMTDVDSCDSAEHNHTHTEENGEGEDDAEKEGLRN